MSVRMKLTHSKTASRRAHHRAGVPRLVHTASGARRMHFADALTGTYRGKQILAVGAFASNTTEHGGKKATDKSKSE